MGNREIHIGTCSWKYDSWEGLVYSSAKPENYLQEYSAKYSTVEVDQWFWSLFDSSVVLPKPNVVREYMKSVPDDFLFGIKVPNSITLTHHYKKKKSDPLLPNTYFLSVELMERFLESIEPLFGKLGPLMFQFEYLNKQKMRGQTEFQERFGEFLEKLPKGLLYSIEIRNPNYLNERYFNFLRSTKLSSVFLQGYYMPPIFQVFQKYKSFIPGTIIIRLHGPNRSDIEELTGGKWDKIVAPRDDDLNQLVEMLTGLESEVFLYVNNHFEGSAPRTISKIKDKLDQF